MTFLSEDQLKKMGFLSLGKDVLISNKASFYNCQNISIGNRVRIDDFCLLSAGEGGIFLGNFIHIAAYSSLIGAGKIALSDFCNLSSRVSIYSSSDDYSGVGMTNPMISDEYKAVHHGDVVLGKHVIVGCGSVILPELRLEDGVAIGALSLVTQSCDSFTIYAGIPAVKIKKRSSDISILEKNFLKKEIL